MNDDQHLILNGCDSPMNSQARSHGALFTVDFANSSDSDPLPPKPETRRRPVRPPVAPVTVFTRVAPITPPGFEYCDDEPAPRKRPAPAPSSESIDIFVIDDDDPPQRPGPPPSPAPAAPEQVQLPPSTFYTVTRERRKHLNGESIFFSIAGSDSKEKMFTCKYKKSRIYIFKAGRIPRLSEEPDAVMLVGCDFTNFSLRQSIASKELMTVQFGAPRAPSEHGRKVAINLFAAVGAQPAEKLISQNPTDMPDGSTAHAFDGRFAIESVKNTVLVSRRNGPPLVLVRKEGKNALEIEARCPHEAEWVFAIGIASFLAKVR
jgi:hypothetical protein